VDSYSVSADVITRIELIADNSLARIFIEPMVFIAISIRIRMTAITISSSINVKPLGATVRRARWQSAGKVLRFIAIPVPLEQARSSRPFRENATTYRREREMKRSKCSF